MSKTRSRTPEPEHIFVYGTLRPPRADIPEDDSRYYPQVAPYVQVVTSAQRLQGTLSDLGTYPAARPGADIIQGDLLVVVPEALAIMDRLEGHPAFFQRAKFVAFYNEQYHGGSEGTKKSLSVCSIRNHLFPL